MAIALTLLASCSTKARTPTMTAAAAAPTSAPARPRRHDVLATVGDVSVPTTEFETLLVLRVENDDRGDLTAEELADHRRVLAEQLVLREQLAQACRDAGVTIAASAIEQRMSQLRADAPDFAAFLREEGETEASLRAQIAAGLCQDTLLEPALAVSEDEIVAAWRADPGPSSDDGWVRVAGASGESLDALKKFRVAAAEPGADFLALARAAGLNAEIVAEPMPRAVLTDKGIAAIATLKPGEISRPFRVKDGYVVIQLLGVEPPGVLPLAYRREWIAEQLRLGRTVDAWLDLRDELDRRYPVRFHVELEGAR